MTTRPPIDPIERDLRTMTDASADDVRQPTELWKRALEVSRAEERAALTHPGHGSGGERPARGRRLLIALNTVGVAALVLLTVGVWTIAVRTPSPVEEMQTRGEAVLPESEAGTIELGTRLDPNVRTDAAEAAESPTTERAERAFEIERRRASAPSIAADDARDFADAEHALEGVLADADETSRAEEEAGRAATMDSRLGREALAARERDLTRSAKPAGDAPPGLEQMVMAPEAGWVLGEGHAGVLARRQGPELPIESATIMLEVENATEAFVRVSQLPDDALLEYSTLGEKQGSGVNELYLNVAPVRTDAVLDELRRYGRVVEEARAPDSLELRTARAAQSVAKKLEPLRETLESLGLEPGMHPHHRAHLLRQIDTAEFVEKVEAAVLAATRQLEDAERSADLSRIRVLINERGASDGAKGQDSDE